MFPGFRLISVVSPNRLVTYVPAFSPVSLESAADRSVAGVAARALARSRLAQVRRQTSPTRTKGRTAVRVRTIGCAVRIQADTLARPPDRRQCPPSVRRECDVGSALARSRKVCASQGIGCGDTPQECIPSASMGNLEKSRGGLFKLRSCVQITRPHGGALVLECGDGPFGPL